MEVRDALKELVGNKPVYCKLGRATNVSSTHCDVTLIEDENVIYTGVRLKAHVGDDLGIIVRPVKDSYVLICFLSATDAFIAHCNEVDNVSYKLHDHTLIFGKDGFDLSMASGKFRVLNSNTSMLDVFKMLYNMLKSFTLMTPNGPTEGLQVDTRAALEKFKVEYEKLIK